MALIVFGRAADSLILVVETVEHLIRLTVESVDGPHEQVVGDILEVSAEPQPWSGHRDVVGGALSLSLDEQRHVGIVVTVPCRERLQALQPLACRRYYDLGVASVVGRRNKSLVVDSESLRWEHIARWLVESHLHALFVDESVGGGVEVESAGNGKGHGELR